MIQSKKVKSLLACLICLTIIFSSYNSVFANSSSVYLEEVELEGDFDRLLGKVKPNEIIGGFEKVKSDYVSDYGANAITYQHIKTGATVLVIDNKDEEKFFTIGFKTPPTDNTGVNHVFEHTTLQGSKNYPVKSMLTTLGSTSMATFFNAATSDDFTFYPFGSINEKDYYNLMTIYLDGLFYPMVMTDENVFKRDGVRLDFIEDQLTYNGVVYNEMKNSGSNTKAILYNSIKKSLYPDTYYKWASGGTPEAITGLTYEDVLKLHEEYYHPSNSLTVLYGKQNLKKSLELLNYYFEKFEKKVVAFELGYQTPYTKMEKYYSTYPVETDNTTARSILSLNYVIPEDHNYEDTMIDFILLDLLMLGNTNSVKQVVTESGLTSSLAISTNSVQVNQGAISFYSMDIESRYEDVFVEVIESAIKKAKKDGFKKKDIEAVFNAYKYGEISSNTGANIGYKAGISALSGWMYNDDPTIMLNNKDLLDKIKVKLNSKIFEKAIDELFLSNPFKSLVVINPDKKYRAKEAKVLDEKLKSITDHLTPKDKLDIIKQTESFYSWQNTPDTNKALATLPKLNLSDISNEHKTVEISQPVDIQGSKVIQTYLDTGGISNIMLSFDAATIPQEKLQYLQLMILLLGNTSTKNYRIDDLIQQELNCFGSFKASLESVSKSDSFSPRFNVNIKTLNEKNALLLTGEILNNSIFDDKDLVKRNLEQLKLNYENSLSELTVPLVDYLTQAMTSEQGKLDDYIEGYEFYKFVSEMLVRLDYDWDKTLNNLEEVRKLVLNKNDLVVGYTNTIGKQETFIENIKPLILSFSSAKNKKHSLKFRAYGETIAVISGNSTLSVNQVGNIKEFGYQYNGNMLVLANVISKGYLWPYIREQGGAYHAGINIYKNGSVRMMSYADPNFMNTIKVYQNIPLFINNISPLDQTSLEGFIISTAANIDNSLQEYNLWNYGINNYISGYNLDNVYKQKQQILETTMDDIKNYSRLFQKLNSNSKYIVVGNKKVIMQNADLFDEIIELK